MTMTTTHQRLTDSPLSLLPLVVAHFRVPELLSDLSLSLNELEHLKEACEKVRCGG